MNKDRRLGKSYMVDEEALRYIVEESGTGVEVEDVSAALARANHGPDSQKSARKMLAIGAALRVWQDVPKWRHLPLEQRQELKEEGFELIYDEIERRND